MIIKLAGYRANELEPKLVAWSLNDESGDSADRASLTFEELDFLPPSGTAYKITVNNEPRGSFEVSSIEEELNPKKVIIQLSPAKFNIKDKTGFREARKRTFSEATIKDVVTSVMQPHGYKVRIDPELASVKTPHLNQNEETDSAFIRRLAKKFDAVTKPVNGLYIFGKKGNITALSGKAKKSVSVSPKMLIKKTGKVKHPTNVRRTGVKASYRESDTGLNGEVVIGAAPFHLMKEMFKNKDEATQRAEAKLQEFTRNGQTFTGAIEGQAGFFAESVLTLDGFNNKRIAGSWSIDSVKLAGTRTRYTIAITATRPKG